MVQISPLSEKVSSRQIAVGISDMKVSNRESDVLITYSLGSCIGVTVYDATAGVGGMIHCLLPQADMNPEKAKAKPEMFVDSGVTALLQEVYRMGAERKRLIVKVAGGGTFLDEKGVFRIGERNYTVLRKVLWKNNLLIKGESVGGTNPRTLCLYMANGVTTIRTGGKEIEI